MQKVSLSAQKSVAVIGGGPCGILCAKYLIEEGLTPIIFEQSGAIGGQWNQGAAHSSMWKHLCANTPRACNNLADMSLPSDSELYIPCKKYQKFLENYAQNFGVSQQVRLNTKVLECNLTQQQKFQVKFQAQNQLQQEEIFDFAVLATGRYNKPFIPQYKGTESFQGQQYHSMQFDSIRKSLFDKRVLVVGGHISAIEVAQNLVEFSEEVYMSLRNPKYVIPKQVGNNYPMLNYLNTAANVKLQRYNPKKFIEFMNEFKDTYMGEYECIGGLPRSHDIRKPNSFTVGQFYPGYVAEGKIKEKRDIKEFQGKRVVFSDESVLDDIDAVIYCTGFQLNIDILGENLQQGLKIENNNKWLNLYKHVLHPQQHNLGVLGMQLISGSSINALELATRALAKVFAGKQQLPQQNVIDREQEQFQNWAGHAAYISPPQMCEELSSFIGCRPVYKDHPEIAKALFFGPYMGEKYRLDGYNKQDGAYQRFVQSLKDNDVPYKVGDMSLNEKERNLMLSVIEANPQDEEIEQLKEIFKYSL